MSKGFLAGIFDAEGSRSQHVLRIANGNVEVIGQITKAMQRFGFNAAVEEPRADMYNVRIRGGLAEQLRFFHTTGPAITRKWSVEGIAIKHRRICR